MIQYLPQHQTKLLEGFTLEDLEYLTDSNPYLRGYLHGYLAELVLMRKLRTIPGVDSVVKIPDLDKQKGDLEVQYLGVTMTIECKSIGSGSVKPDESHDSWTGAVSMKSSDKRKATIDGEERSFVNVDKGQFDILAVNCFVVNGSWDFVFIENKFLLEKDDTPGYITSRLHINPKTTPGLTENVSHVLHKVFLQKLSSCELK